MCGPIACGSATYGLALYWNCLVWNNKVPFLSVLAVGVAKSVPSRGPS